MDPVTYTYDAAEMIHVIRGDQPPVGAHSEPRREGGTDPNGGDAVTTYTYAALAAAVPLRARPGGARLPTHDGRRLRRGVAR